MELHHLAAEWATDQMIKLFRGAHLVPNQVNWTRQAAIVVRSRSAGVSAVGSVRPLVDRLSIRSSKVLMKPPGKREEGDDVLGTDLAVRAWKIVNHVGSQAGLEDSGRTEDVARPRRWMFKKDGLRLFVNCGSPRRTFRRTLNGQ